MYRNPADDRLMLLRVKQKEVLNIFRYFHGLPDKAIHLPKMEGIAIPEDATVVNVNHDFHCRSFILTIHSMEYEIIEPGMYIPEIAYLDYKLHWIKLPSSNEMKKCLSLLRKNA